ncbi:MAG: ATP-dependent helicase, partial [Okeania sp. SIO2H7]|nr:ATP-dependent helicase [Okeania sp. SIO2H7]
LAQHFPERTLVFTADNATVYRISHDFLIPAITYQTPVKERHQILTKFKTGEYKTLVASHVLNEGVDVPDAKIAIILSGTGSEREYIQRLGRVLRKGSDKNKLAILYEVVAEDTTEERTSMRRKGVGKSREVRPRVERMPKEREAEQLEIPELEVETSETPKEPIPIYGVNKSSVKMAAESSAKGKYNANQADEESEDNSDEIPPY